MEPIDLMANQLTTLAFRRAERSGGRRMRVTLSGSLLERVVEVRKGRIFKDAPRPICRLEGLLDERGIQLRILYSNRNPRTRTIEVAQAYLLVENRFTFLELERAQMEERTALANSRLRVLRHTPLQECFMGGEKMLVTGDKYAIRTSSDFFEDDFFPKEEKEELHLDGSRKQLRQIDRFTRGNTHFIEHLSVTARKRLTFLAHKYNFNGLEASCVEPVARNRSNSLSPSVLRRSPQTAPQDAQS